MRCPNKKCRGNKLQTKRTFDNGTSTKREKYCPKCRNRFYSIEISEDDYQQITNDRAEVVRTAELKADRAEEKFEEVQEAVKVLFRLTDTGKKGRAER